MGSLVTTIKIISLDLIMYFLVHLTFRLMWAEASEK